METVPSAFVRELRSALHHIYNLDELGRSALMGWFEVQRDALDLQSVLLQAIDALKPRPGTPSQAPAWRRYRALYHRYTEQFSQAEVARALGLSSRQLLRQERAALLALAAYLWARHGLGARCPAASNPEGQAKREQRWSRGQELAWLRESQPCEAVDLAQLVETVLETARPVLCSLAVRVEWMPPAGMPPLLARYGPLRQALLHLLLAAARSVPAGVVVVAVSAHDRQAHVTLNAVMKKGATSAGAPVGEALALSHELVSIAGGTLESPTGRTFSARVTLQLAGQATVLFVDDNADALLLYQRCLAGTCYRYAGTSDAQQTLSLAAELRPYAIVLDVMLPGIDGWELLGRIRNNPSTRAIPVIVCTILSEEQLALALGAAAFMRKPVVREALLATLDAQTGYG